VTAQVAPGDGGVTPAATGDTGVTQWLGAEVQRNLIEPMADLPEPEQE
jgi:hypothetical protein